MRVVFVCLGDPFSEQMLYVENYFIKACQEERCEILVIADNFRYEQGRLVEGEEETLEIGRQTTLIRIKYDKVVTPFLTKKIRKSKCLYGMLEGFKPDVIFYNCIQIYNIVDIKRLKHKFPDVRIYGEVSTTKYNSGMNFLSKYILHRIIYKSWIRSVEQYFTKIYYIVPESKEFLVSEYGVNEKYLKFNPLPAKVISEVEKLSCRKIILNKYNLNDSDILLVHSGKMGRKKRTIEILKIFKKNTNANMKLLIAGSFSDDIREEAMLLIESDSRICYTGFLKGEDLVQLLCAADLYLQPGSPSQTAQTAMGCWCPVVLPNIETYIPFFNDNGYLINDIGELDVILNSIDKQSLDIMSRKSREVAERLLDYKMLARELYE